MTLRIGVIVHEQELVDAVQQMAQRLSLAVAVAVADDGEACALAHTWAQEGQVRVVVARGPASARIRTETDLFAVPLYHTTADVVAALLAARPLLQTGDARDAVAVIQAASPRRCEAVAVGRMLGLTVESLAYADASEQDSCLQRAAGLGAQVVICDDPALAARAADHHLRAVLLRYSPETLQATLEQAADRLRVVRWERGRDFLGRILFELTGQGMVVANSKGVITAVRGKAEKLLGIEPRAAVGLTLEAAAHKYPRFASILQDGGEVSGELIKAGDTPLVVDRRSLQVDGELRGLVLSFQPASHIELLEGKIRKQLYTQGLVARHTFDDLIGASEALQQVVDRAQQYARSNLSVQITGESGTGKELFAQSIHNASPRRDGPFVAVNCAALPENLLESELFGYEDGAFTGARKGGKPGLFELAHRGTIFLDEVGELPLHLQARLLRVVEEREVMRLGGDRIIPVDIRIISATNRDLGRAVADGHFRADLYYRLSVLTLKLPPLRARRHDIGLLCRHFLHAEAARQGLPVQHLSGAMVSELQAYDWPGNVRELANVIRRFLLLSSEAPDPARVLKELLSELPAHQAAGPPDPDLAEDVVRIRVGPMEEMVGEIIAQLHRTRPWDMQELARRLAISRTTVWKRLRQARPEGAAATDGAGGTVRPVK